MKKVNGVLLIVLALVIGIVPVLTDCLAHGKSLTTAEGKVVPMKCHWTAIAEIGVAIPLGLAGVLNITSKRKETMQALSGFGGTLGILALLFPTVLIGVCANAMMPCNMVEKPVLLMSGILVVAISAFNLFNSRKMVELAA